MTDVVADAVLVPVVVLVPVETAPGACVSPADADITIVMLRIDAAHIWRKVFTWLPPSVKYKNFVAYKNFVITLEQPGIWLQGSKGRA